MTSASSSECRVGLVFLLLCACICARAQPTQTLPARIPEEILTELKGGPLCDYAAVAKAYGVEPDQLAALLEEAMEAGDESTCIVAAPDGNGGTDNFWIMSRSEYGTEYTEVFCRDGAWLFLGGVNGWVRQVTEMAQAPGFILTVRNTLRGTGVYEEGPAHYWVSRGRGVEQMLAYQTDGYNASSSAIPAMKFESTGYTEIRVVGDCVEFCEEVSASFDPFGMSEDESGLIHISGPAIFRYDLKQRKVIPNRTGEGLFTTSAQRGIDVYDFPRFLRLHAGEVRRTAEAADLANQEGLRAFAQFFPDRVARAGLLSVIQSRREEKAKADHLGYGNASDLAESAVSWLNSAPLQSFCSLLGMGLLRGRTCALIHFPPPGETPSTMGVRVVDFHTSDEAAWVDHDAPVLLDLSKLDANTIKVGPEEGTGTVKDRLWRVSLAVPEGSSSRYWSTPEPEVISLFFASPLNANLSAHAMAILIEAAGGTGLRTQEGDDDTGTRAHEAIEELALFWDDLLAVVQREDKPALLALLHPAALIDYGKSTGAEGFLSFWDRDAPASYWTFLREALGSGGRFLADAEFPAAASEITSDTFSDMWIDRRAMEPAYRDLPAFVAEAPVKEGRADGEHFVLEIAGTTKSGVRIGHGYEGPLRIVSMCLVRVPL